MKKRVAFFIAIFLVFAAVAVSASAYAQETGFAESEGKLYYISEETQAAFVPEAEGFWPIEGKTFYFFADGSVKTVETDGLCKIGDLDYYFHAEDNHVEHPETAGVFVVNEKPYYFYEDAHVEHTGTAHAFSADEKWYYADENGILQKGWIKTTAATYFAGDDYALLTGKQDKYCFDADGKLLTGLQTIDGALYYYDATTGEQKTGWLTIGKDRYYFAKKTGAAVTGLTEISKQLYCFSADGKMQTGMQTVNGKTYYFAPKTGVAATGLTKISKKLYYFAANGTMQTGLQTIDGSTYYFAPKTGIAATGLTTVSKKLYCFAADGTMQTGMLTVDGSTYYFAPKTGIAATGLTRIAKDLFYFAENGTMQTGLKTVDGSTYYFAPKTGIAATGLTKIDKEKYYFDEDGTMQTGLQTIDDATYYFAPKGGKMKTGWNTINKNKYYFAPKTGVMTTGWKQIDKSYYYFGNNGKLRTSTIVGKYYVLSSGKRATSNAVRYAVSVINAVSKPGMTKMQQLRACYNWCMYNINYARNHTNPANLKYDWRQSYASNAFTKHTGNCYSYASAFAYCARILGYNARVAIGKISSSHGMTAHGWTELVIGNKTYICDSVQQRYYGGNFWMRTYRNYPKRLSKSAAYKISLY